MEETGRWTEPYCVPMDISFISDFKLSYLIDVSGDMWQFVAQNQEVRRWINVGQS